MRPIDADALIEFIDMGHLRNPLECCYSERDVVDMLESRPTIEQPQSALWTGFGYFKCSSCGGEAPDDGWWRSPFCPHCGKPMENAKEYRA